MLGIFLENKQAVLLVLLGFFGVWRGGTKKVDEKSCADFFCAYVYPPCSKQNALQSE
jgi:hypothetical protein